MYYVYILRLRDGSYYSGSTRSVTERLGYHNARKVKSTRNKLPCILMYIEKFETRSEAQTREYQIKKWKSRKAIERLIINTPLSGPIV
ncbi:MAG: GIY-YIG nuclease family protein [Patescibacteria group bacterium]